MNCVFCSIIEKNEPHHEIVWQNDTHVAFLDAHPKTAGHTLVIPRTHIDNAFDLDTHGFGDLMETCRALARSLRMYSGAPRIALAIDGFQVPHAHVHLVPVARSGDLSKEPTDPSPEALAREGELLRAHLASTLII